MTRLALLRHAPTTWNQARRLQGRADVALADDSAAVLRSRRLPPDVTGFRSLVSPLKRCRETAKLLGLTPTLDARLIEMDWGDYEGRTLSDLRQRFGADFDLNERRGLDFRPPGGESPRDVQARVRPLLAEIAAAAQPTLAVTHRGVIRAIYALARDWDMSDDPAEEMDLYALHMFALDAQGAPRIERLNIALPPAAETVRP